MAFLTTNPHISAPTGQEDPHLPYTDTFIFAPAKQTQAAQSKNYFLYSCKLLQSISEKKETKTLGFALALP